MSATVPAPSKILGLLSAHSPTQLGSEVYFAVGPYQVKIMQDMTIPRYGRKTRLQDTNVDLVLQLIYPLA